MTHMHILLRVSTCVHGFSGADVLLHRFPRTDWRGQGSQRQCSPLKAGKDKFKEKFRKSSVARFLTVLMYMTWHVGIQVLLMEWGCTRVARTKETRPLRWRLNLVQWESFVNFAWPCQLIRSTPKWGNLPVLRQKADFMPCDAKFHHAKGRQFQSLTLKQLCPMRQLNLVEPQQTV